jgi:hypothetical protein
MIDFKILSRQNTNNGFDYTTASSFEKTLKVNFYQLFAELWKTDPNPLFFDNTTQLYADSPIRINLAYDQGTARIPDAFREIKASNNNIEITNVLTLGGLVDPGRFLQVQKIGYTGMFSGMFNLDDPFVQGKFAMDNIKFVFNLVGYPKKLFEMSCYPALPAVTNPEKITIDNDFMVLRINGKEIKAGKTAAEGSISKFCGDFFQTLYNITYNLSRKNQKQKPIKYVMASGDGVAFVMNAFMSIVMDDDFCFILDDYDKINYKRGQVLYGLSKYIKVKRESNRVNLTNNNNNSPIAKKLFVPIPSPRLPKVRPVAVLKNRPSTKPGSRPRSLTTLKKTPRTITAAVSKRTPVNTIMVNANVRTTRSRSRSARK